MPADLAALAALWPGLTDADRWAVASLAEALAARSAPAAGGGRAAAG